jgi:ketosteroid isomerase-like protein
MMINNSMLVLLALLVPSLAPARTVPAASEALAGAEREFAAEGLRDGVQKSFLARFSSDSIVLKPFAVSGREYYRAHPDGAGKLHWAPQYLVVSAAGDFGFSSGPWRYEAERDGKTIVAHGHFFSIWRHDRDGWRVAFDHGIGHAASAPRVEATPLVALELGKGAPAVLPGPAADRRRAQLTAADDALRERLARDPVGGYGSAARRDTLWLREGAQPLRAASPPAGAAPPCGCGPRVGADMAASGDFGYTIGGSAEQRGKGVDVRIWRFDAGSGWTLLADLSAAVE